MLTDLSRAETRQRTTFKKQGFCQFPSLDPTGVLTPCEGGKTSAMALKKHCCPSNWKELQVISRQSGVHRSIVGKII